MVNEEPSPRSAILSRLRSSEGYLPGTRLCDELGISRVAVWKHMEALKSSGYGIDSDRGGYRLSKDGDFLYPWEFPEAEKRFRHFNEVDSTMEEALGAALSDAGKEWIVVAESQRRGRGRRGRSWKSDPGGLFCTFVLYPALTLAEVQRPVLAGGIALCRAVRDITGENAWLEWPNDLYLGGKKVAGILPEFLYSGEELRFYSLGLGINVSNRVQGPKAASLNAITGGRARRRDILRSFMRNFDPMRERGFMDGSLADSWWSLSASAGRPVRGEGGELLGRAVGITGDGSLIVEDGQGRTVNLAPGRAFMASKGEKRE